MIIKPFGLGGAKRETEIPKKNVAMFALFEEMLTAMGLAYQLRCRKCNEQGFESDYCWGNNESNASQYVVECNCTKRVYKGADVKIH